ncbi:MAG: hypothetical protein IPL52_13225 [Flavobacteriales bacterium]|nr:hypothetical protein [Flavobacteriales bacterium]
MDYLIALVASLGSLYFVKNRWVAFIIALAMFNLISALMGGLPSDGTAIPVIIGRSTVLAIFFGISIGLWTMFATKSSPK